MLIAKNRINRTVFIRWVKCLLISGEPGPSYIKPSVQYEFSPLETPFLLEKYQESSRIHTFGALAMEYFVKYGSLVKPIVDKALAFSVLLFFSPLLILISVCSLLLGLPVVFSQVRPGYRLQAFKVYKFTSIPTEGARANPVKRWYCQMLRRSSLDELPQLINVLRGDMSLIGPRPLLMEYLSLYSEDQLARHQVKPGITGWAQVHGRNVLSLNEKVAYDLYYVRHQSLWLDCLILMMTVRQLLLFHQADYHIHDQALWGRKA